MEERLKFLSSGDKPRKNKDVMNEVMKELKADGLYFDASGKPAAGGDEDTKKDKKEAKKRSKPEAAADLSDEDERPKKKKKKSKD
jgi:hypothetical protein